MSEINMHIYNTKILSTLLNYSLDIMVWSLYNYKSKYNKQANLIINKQIIGKYANYECKNNREKFLNNREN